MDRRLIWRDGYIKLDEKKAFKVNWIIAMEIREAYKGALGNYPYNSAD